ncbi:MAG: PIN domain nuclease [Balneolaceae bacterium]|nr:PIN domain nuclease [Balneolaceae bacterium]
MDTSVWIDYFNGVVNWQTDYLEQSLSSDSIIIGDIILTEILRGFRKDRDYYTARDFLDFLECVQLGGKEMAMKSASNYRFLRSGGITIRKTVDLIVGTWCAEHSMPLLHNDKDFDHMAKKLDLKVVSKP